MSATWFGKNLYIYWGVRSLAFVWAGRLVFRVARRNQLVTTAHGWRVRKWLWFNFSTRLPEGKKDG